MVLRIVFATVFYLIIPLYSLKFGKFAFDRHLISIFRLDNTNTFFTFLTDFAAYFIFIECTIYFVSHETEAESHPIFNVSDNDCVARCFTNIFQHAGGKLYELVPPCDLFKCYARTSV